MGGIAQITPMCLAGATSAAGWDPYFGTVPHPLKFLISGPRAARPE
jgi:hypothetical protein